MKIKKRTKTEFIAIHCSASQAHSNIGVKELRAMHKARGFADVGYHFVIRRDGTIETGREISLEGAHEQAINKISVAVCLIGGVDGQLKPKDNFTAAQRRSLAGLVRRLVVQFPGAKVGGHNHWEKSRGCPSFDWRDWVLKNGFPIV